MLIERPNLEAEVASILERFGLAATAARAAVDEIMAGLASEEVRRSLASVFNAAYVSASSASCARDDLYLPMNSTGVVSEVLAETAMRYFRPSDPPVQLDARAAAAQVRSISYRDWQFDLVKLGDPNLLGVRVKATLQDTRGDGVFHSSTVAPVRGRGVYAAAFSAIMALEEHEARERFFADGKRVLSPHIADEYPEPTNVRIRG